MSMVEQKLNAYVERHPLVAELGDEYIMQNDKAEIEALSLICDIFNSTIEGNK